MNTTSLISNAKQMFTPMVLAAAFAVPAFADYADDVANTPQQTASQVGGRDRAYVLPPLSDHIDFVLVGDDSEVAFNDDDNDGTARQYNRGYYEEPEQVAMVVLMPSDLEAIEQENVSDDDTAQQYDRGYYKEPDTVMALVIVVADHEEE